MEIKTLRLPESLRKELGKPKGIIFEGTAEENAPKVKKFIQENGIKFVIAVGDVVGKALHDAKIFPNVIVTDGQTKRKILETQLAFEGYKTIHARSPAAVISKEAWQKIREICTGLNEQSRIHMIIEGEEDLLALPFIVELPENSIVVYGQPNVGAVVIPVTQSKKFLIENLMKKMES